MKIQVILLRNRKRIIGITMFFVALIFVFGMSQKSIAVTNLLTNGDFSNGSTGWTIIENGGSGAAFSGSYNTSYTWNSISQTVDLLAAGYTTEELDTAPSITFNVETMQRFDHDGQYYLEYKLLAANGTTVVTSSLYGSSGSPIYLSANTAWFDTEYTFIGYGTGVRYAYIKIAGRDGSPDWAGQYGPYFDNASIAMADTINPTVSSLLPADNATGVSVTSTFVITFDENVVTSTGNIILYKTTDDSVVETFPVTSTYISASGTTAFVIDPSVTLESETEYYFLIDATAIDDSFGNSFVGITASTTWSFTTADIVAPIVSNTSPSGEQRAGTTVVTLSVTTNEHATCKYSTNSGTMFGSMIVFSTTGGTTHTTPVIVSDGSSYLYYLLCQDESANESNQTTVSFSVAAQAGGSFSPPPAPVVVVPPRLVSGSINSSVNRVYQMAISSREDFSGASWEPYNESYQSSNTRVYVKFRSPEGGVSEVFVVAPNRESTVRPVLADVSPAQFEGRLIRYEHDPKVYIIEGSVKRWIMDEQTFVAQGYNWQEIQIVASHVMFDEGSPVTMLSIAKEPIYRFSRDLFVGVQGDDVKELQRYLNRQGFTLAENGVASPGQETVYFGELTRNALIRFQQTNGISPAIGYFGPKTRAVVNE